MIIVCVSFLLLLGISSVRERDISIIWLVIAVRGRRGTIKRLHGVGVGRDDAKARHHPLGTRALRHCRTRRMIGDGDDEVGSPKGWFLLRLNQALVYTPCAVYTKMAWVAARCWWRMLLFDEEGRIDREFKSNQYNHFKRQPPSVQFSQEPRGRRLDAQS